VVVLHLAEGGAGQNAEGSNPLEKGAAGWGQAGDSVAGARGGKKDARTG